MNRREMKLCYRLRQKRAFCIQRVFVPTRTYWPPTDYRDHSDRSYWDETNDRNDYSGSWPSNYSMEDN